MYYSTKVNLADMPKGKPAKRAEGAMCQTSIASLVNKYLKDRGIDTWAVASGTGLVQSDIDAALNGKRELPLSKYMMICDFLGVPYEKFIEESACRA